jgi:dCMP deaminase
MNAIIYAAKAGISIDGAVMYTTLSPCRGCMKHLKQVGLQHVYFEDLYRKTSPAQHELDKEFCANLGLGLTQISTKS